MTTAFKFKHVLLASLLAISLPSLAHAERDGDKAHHGMHQSGAPYLRGLDLTSAQKDQLFNLNYAQIPTLREHHKQHQQLREELRASAQADKFDDAKVQQLADKAAKLEKEKVLAMARNDAKIFALLTPEQRKKAREFKMEAHGFGRGDDRHEGGDDKRPARFKAGHRPTETRNM